MDVGRWKDPFCLGGFLKKQTKVTRFVLSGVPERAAGGRTLWHVPDTCECKFWLSKFTTWVTRTISFPSLGLQDLILGLIVTAVPLAGGGGGGGGRDDVSAESGL